VEIGIDASRAFQSGATGIGVYATEIISRLVLTPPAPLRLYLNRSRPPEAAPHLAQGSEWRCIPFPRGWTALRLRWELGRNRPGLLWVPAYRLPGGALPRSVVTVHGVEHRQAPSAYPGAAGRSVESFVLDTLRRAARVISPSETTKADLVHLYGADPSRVTVIPHGVSAAMRRLDPDAYLPVLRSLGVEPPYFLVAGAHHLRKNVPFLVRQFARAFSPGGAGGPLLVVTNATGERARAILAEAAERGVGGRVLLLGHLGDGQLAALYCGALAACVPSLYEGFGLPALDAMACGTAVMANGVGGVQEIAEGAALLLKPDDPDGWVDGLRRLGSEPALRDHLGQLGAARATRFSWDRSAAAHAELLGSELRLAAT
jgi:glycosyltransferase involved in cell wall biosynthesis